MVAKPTKSKADASASSSSKKVRTTWKGRTLRKSHVVSVRLDRGSRTRGRHMSGERMAVAILKCIYPDRKNRPKADATCTDSANRIVDEFLKTQAEPVAHELINKGQTTIGTSVITNALTTNNALSGRFLNAGLKAMNSFEAVQS